MVQFIRARASSETRSPSVIQKPIRNRLACQGAVQGVGFRPFVFRLAMELGLFGWVRNGPDGVVIEVEGPPTSVEEFALRLPKELPPLARLDAFEYYPIEITNDFEFAVVATEQGARKRALVPPDSRLCDDCRKEMEDPEDRRWQYPFTVCTNCGPRLSLVHSLPYDREKTAMACFPLCSECQAEYNDPGNRRFHTEPVCCPQCGPRLWSTDINGETTGEGEEAIVQARKVLEVGGIVALKGLGGFQLACDASSSLACETLRQRKNRPGKPFAVMVKDIVDAREIVNLNVANERFLLGPRSPILLAPKRKTTALCNEVAPGIDDVGVMIPTTPLHVELFRHLNLRALVMTSANASEEPICKGNREALDRLGHLADCFLLHDRDVVRRVDDSVARSVDQEHVMVRRSRGWVPDPVPLVVATPQPVLALGGHLQVTTCFAIEDQAFPSQHVGDLDSTSARAFHLEVTEGLREFLQTEPKLIVIDEHPDYPSSQLGKELAEKWNAKVMPVQHHLAHVVAAAAEHGRFPKVGEQFGGLALDGTGFGPDSTAWGGEVLQFGGDLKWQRVAHLQPLPLLGGEAAVREPWRLVVAALAMIGKLDLLDRLPLAKTVSAQRLDLVRQLAQKKGGSWPMASGAGRLFEAAGALCGLVDRNDYEGEAALRFESLAASSSQNAVIWEDMRPHIGASKTTLPSAQLLAAAARRLASRQEPAVVAADFHATFCHAVATMVRRNLSTEIRTIALGGGCLINRLLRRGLQRELEALGYECLLATDLPPGDGGLSFGQAVIGAAALARNCEPQQIEVPTCV
jgi:hydrogenase maturation protein HypF